MTDRLRDALEALADRGRPADSEEFAERVVRAARLHRRPRWLLPTAAALVAVVGAAVAVPALLPDDEEERVATVPTPPPPPTSRPLLGWARVDLPDVPEDGTSSLSAVTTDDEAIVAVGSTSARDEGSIDALAYYSEDDGKSWHRAEGLSGAAGEEVMLDVAVVNRHFVAVGRVGQGVAEQDAAVWTSEDGRRWTRVQDPSGALGGPLGQSAEAVTSSKARLVAVGVARERDHGSGIREAPAAWFSDDEGVSWHRAPVEPPADGTAYATAVTATRAGFVMTGAATSGAGEVGYAAVWTSADGTRWTAVPRDEAAFPLGTWMLGVSADRRGVTGVGPRGSVWTSPDGRRWTRVPQDQKAFGPTTSHLRGVGPFEGGWIAVGAHDPTGPPGVWTSDHGAHWTHVADPAFTAVRRGEALDVAYTGRAVVVVGKESHVRRNDRSSTVPVAWVAH